MRTNLMVLIIFCFVFTTQIIAQTTDTTLIKIETADGNEFIGKIISEESDQVILETNRFGKITIQKADIKSREFIKPQQIKDGKLWFENPQATRYFWSPNAYGLKKGEGYYQNIYVLWNQFSVGVTENFSVGAGVIPLFLFGGGPTPIFATAKFSIPVSNEKFNIGGGAIVGTVLGEDIGGFGILYGVSTVGDKDKNITLGIGYGFADGELAKTPLINLSGLIRLSSRGYFISENYFLHVDGESGGVISLGGRWLIKKASLDFLLAIPYAPDMNRLVTFPVVGFSIPFGKT